MHETFKSCAIARGLLQDDGELQLCLMEACISQMPSQLRSLFATLLLFCEVCSPLHLWNEFSEEFAEDFAHQLSEVNHPPGDIAGLAKEMALADLSRLLAAGGKTNVDFDLPPGNPDAGPGALQDLLDMNEVVEQMEIATANESRLNAGQRQVYDAVVDAVLRPSSGLP